MQRYGLNWPSDFTDFDIEKFCARKGGKWIQDGKEYGMGLFHHYRQAESLLWPDDEHNRWSDLGLQRITENDITVFMGASDCISGETVIEGTGKTIRYLSENKIAPTVMTLDGPKKAGVPFVKGNDFLYEVKLENGQSFKATKNHVVLSESGFVPVCGLRKGQFLFSYDLNPPGSTSELAPSTRKPNARHFRKTKPDYQDHYSPDFRLYGEPPQLSQETAQSFSPSQADVLKHREYASFDWDDLGNRLERNRPCLSMSLLSNLDFWRLLKFGEQPQAHTPSKTYGRAYCESQSLWPYSTNCVLPGRVLKASLYSGNISPASSVSILENGHRISLGLPLRSQSSSRTLSQFSQGRDLCGKIPIGACFAHRGDSNNVSYSFRVSMTQVVSITKTQKDTYYDIHVPDAHHYFANGTIHHNSGKSYLASRFILTDWWFWPENTLWMISSTELRGAELRIWGTIKQLFNRARERYPELPGSVLESKHAITTEEISDDGSEARLLTKGLIFIPCKQGNQWVGMGAYQGIKSLRIGNKEGRLGHCGDETSAMERVFLDAYSNWYGKANFRGLMLGNPYDLEDSLCAAAEPVNGWDTWVDTEKTQEWRSKFYNAWVVAFDGRDTPNNDFPGPFTKYKYLIGNKKLEAVAATHGKDSWQWHNQCVGKPRPHAAVRRVITRNLCEQHKAFDEVIWSGSKVTRVAGCDAAYGGVGGDRCVGGHIEFGKDVNGADVISIHPPILVPVSVRNLEEPEVQIAKFMRDYCEGFAIPPQNFFFDGRSTLAVRFAQHWSPEVNVVDFGGPPTDRPVSQDEYMWDGADKTKRLKRCDEHYDRFVTELWFAVYYLIVSEQLRRLPKDVASEGYQRTWEYTKGNRMSVETKAKMKERTSKSPDLFDWLVTCIEGARRLGFSIAKLGGEDEEKPPNDWLIKLHSRQKRLTDRMALNYSA